MPPFAWRWGRVAHASGAITLWCSVTAFYRVLRLEYTRDNGA
jgi:hypothetical protein